LTPNSYEQDDGWDGVWKFKQILDHQGPIKANDDHYRGARYNVLIKWETGERMWEPLLWADKQGMYDHANENGLLDTPGWHLPGLKKLAKTQK
jgi:hypothetical protein